MCRFNTFTWYQSRQTAKKKLHQNFLQVQKIEDNGKMEFQKEFILTPYNYFAWKEKIAIHLRSRGLYRLTMNTDTEPTSAIEKSKYLNRMDEALGTICSLISPDLLFHISSCKTPNEAWTILEGIFGKQDEMRGHMLEVELLTLDPKSFENIQDFFTKFKDLLSQLKACGVDKSKEEKQMVLTILSKIGPEFSVFISTFHTVRFTSGATWKMPSLEDFIESLTQEQTKLINMGTIKGPRVHALTVHDGSHKYQKSKDKYKRKISCTYEEGRVHKTLHRCLQIQRRKGKKRREMHILSQRIPFGIRMHAKKIDLMSQILQKNNLGDRIPEGAKKKKPEDLNSKKDNSSHALIAINSSPDAWIIDSGASHHMAASEEVYYSLDACKGPPILMGDNSSVEVTEKEGLNSPMEASRMCCMFPRFLSTFSPCIK
jgi:hypothetical protein